MTLTRMDALAQSAAGKPEAEDGSLRLAAIDIGSNSIHMIVAQIDPDGGLTNLWRMKESTGLGRLSFPSRRINAEAMGRALSALGRFKQAARTKAAEKILAAGGATHMLVVGGAVSKE